MPGQPMAFDAAAGGAVVVRAGIHQLDEAAPLFDAYRQFYGYPSDLPAARGYLRARLEAGESTVLLASLGDAAPATRAVGFCQLYPSFCSLDLSPIFVLYDLFVDEGARHSGVAQALLATAAQLGVEAGASRLELSTALDNRPAQALYEAAGWMPDSTYRHYELPLH